MEKERNNMDAIANHPKRAIPDHGPRKANSILQPRWVAKPRQSHLSCEDIASLERVREPALVSASHTPMLPLYMKPAYSTEPYCMPRLITCGESGVGGWKRDISKRTKQREYFFDPPPMPLLEFAYSQPPALLALAGPHTRPSTPDQQILSERDTLGLLEKARIASQRTSWIIELSAFMRNEYPPGSEELEDAGIQQLGIFLHWFWNLIVKDNLWRNPLEWFYPKLSTVAREITCHWCRLVCHHNRNEPLRSLPATEPKAPSSCRCRVREGQVQPGMVVREVRQAMDFEI